MNTYHQTINSDQRPHLIPALDPKGSYVSRLSARSALYSDLRLLLDSVGEPLPASMYRKRLIEENRLARASTSASHKLWKELRSRYILDWGHPLFDSFWSEWGQCETELERGLTAYILFALNDRLVADLGTQWLFTHLRRAPSQVLVEEVFNFIQNAANHHPEVTNWSYETQKSVAKHYMTSIRDFGLARGKTKKFTIRPALYAAPIRLLIRALNLARVKPMDQVRARIFRLLALDGPEVIEALSELNRKGQLRFKIQADVVELDLEATK